MDLRKGYLGFHVARRQHAKHRPCAAADVRAMRDVKRHVQILQDPQLEEEEGSVPCASFRVHDVSARWKDVAPCSGCECRTWPADDRVFCGHGRAMLGRTLLRACCLLHHHAECVLG